eukprot:g1763.t1
MQHRKLATNEEFKKVYGIDFPGFNRPTARMTTREKTNVPFELKTKKEYEKAVRAIELEKNLAARESKKSMAEAMRLRAELASMCDKKEKKEEISLPSFSKQESRILAESGKEKMDVVEKDKLHDKSQERKKMQRELDSLHKNLKEKMNLIEALQMERDNLYEKVKNRETKDDRVNALCSSLTAEISLVQEKYEMLRSHFGMRENALKEQNVTLTNELKVAKDALVLELRNSTKKHVENESVKKQSECLLTACFYLVRCLRPALCRANELSIQKRLLNVTKNDSLNFTLRKAFDNLYGKVVKRELSSSPNRSKSEKVSKIKSFSSSPRKKLRKIMFSVLAIIRMKRKSYKRCEMTGLQLLYEEKQYTARDELINEIITGVDEMRESSLPEHSSAAALVVRLIRLFHPSGGLNGIPYGKDKDNDMFASFEKFENNLQDDYKHVLTQLNDVHFAWQEQHDKMVKKKAEETRREEKISFLQKTLNETELQLKNAIEQRKLAEETFAKEMETHVAAESRAKAEMTVQIESRVQQHIAQSIISKRPSQSRKDATKLQAAKRVLSAAQEEMQLLRQRCASSEKSAVALGETLAQSQASGLRYLQSAKEYQAKCISLESELKMLKSKYGIKEENCNAVIVDDNNSSLSKEENVENKITNEERLLSNSKDNGNNSQWSGIMKVEDAEVDQDEVNRYVNSINSRLNRLYGTPIKKENLPR